MSEICEDAISIAGMPVEIVVSALNRLDKACAMTLSLPSPDDESPLSDVMETMAEACEGYAEFWDAYEVEDCYEEEEEDDDDGEEVRL